MKVLIILVAISSVNCLVPVKEGWRRVKSPLDTPHFREILKDISPARTGKSLLRGRIAGGQMASLGQFPTMGQKSKFCPKIILELILMYFGTRKSNPKEFLESDVI